MSRTLRRTGLRDVALVTVNDTDPRVTAAGGNGTGYLTMMLRVNGAPVYVRGANKIQMDLMDGRLSGACQSLSSFFGPGYFGFPSHPVRTVMYDVFWAMLRITTC